MRTPDNHIPSIAQEYITKETNRVINGVTCASSWALFTLILHQSSIDFITRNVRGTSDLWNGLMCAAVGVAGLSTGRLLVMSVDLHELKKYEPVVQDAIHVGALRKEDLELGPVAQWMFTKRQQGVTKR